MADFESQFISKVVSSGNLDKAIELGVKPAWFQDHTYRKIYLWMLDYYRRFGDVPTASALRHQAPNFRLKEVPDNYEYYVTQFRNQKKRSIAVDAVIDANEALDDDDPVRAISRLTAAAHEAATVGSNNLIKSTPADSIKPRRVTWLWKGRIPRGKITVVAGDAGRGKTTMIMNLIGRLTKGRPLPFYQQAHQPMKCLIMTAEDDYADTLVPRLMAAHADLHNIEFLDGCINNDGEALISLPDDIEYLKTKIETTQAGVLVIDPFNAFLNGKTDTYRDSDVRRVLAPLSKLAEETNTVVLLVFHLNKSASSANALHRIVGSVGIGAAARSVLFVTPNPENEDEQMLAVAKVSNAARPSTLLFELEGTEPYGAARIRWTGRTGLTLEEVMSARKTKQKSTLSIAEKFLEDFLIQNDGEALMSKIRLEAGAAEISWPTVLRAKDSLGVRTKRGQLNRREGSLVYWYLPETSTRLPARKS